MKSEFFEHVENMFVLVTSTNCCVLFRTILFVICKLREKKIPQNITCMCPYNEEPRAGQYWSHLIRDRSSSFVSITIVTVFSSQTIRQKSANVSGSGPCVAMYALGCNQLKSEIFVGILI